MKPSFTVAIVLLGVCLASVQASARGLLLALRQCPNTGPHRACLLIEFQVAVDGSKRATIETTRNSSTVSQSVSLEGKLRQSAAESFQLQIQHDNDNFAFDTDLGALPYLGRSVRNRPIVLTNRGPLEILTRSIDIAYPDGLILVDEQRHRVADRYFESYAKPYVVTHTHAIFVWDQARQSCVSAPRRLPALLTLATSACKEAGLPGEFDDVSGNVIRVYEDDPTRQIELTKIATPATAWAGVANIYKIPGSDMLAIIPHIERE